MGMRLTAKRNSKTPISEKQFCNTKTEKSGICPILDTKDNREKKERKEKKC